MQGNDPKIKGSSPKIAILVPCFNEELTVAGVVRDFKRELPDCVVYVYDNNSRDRTAEIAAREGAVVRWVGTPGKGAVVRAMFREIEADYYVLVDGDGTYPATAVKQLLEPVIADRADMAVGDRHSLGGYRRENTRRFHNFGNGLVTGLINFFFNCRLVDIMSGYRAFNRTFIKNCPILVNGFEIETEMTLHALDKLFRIVEIPIEYKDRIAGSESKLSTFRDGFRVLRSILWVFKDCKPLAFFLMLFIVSAIVAMCVGFPVVEEYLRTGLVPRIPSAILASGLGIVSVLMLAVGFILDTIVKLQRESFEIGLMHFKNSELNRRTGT